MRVIGHCHGGKMIFYDSYDIKFIFEAVYCLLYFSLTSWWGGKKIFFFTIPQRKIHVFRLSFHFSSVILILLFSQFQFQYTLCC